MVITAVAFDATLWYLQSNQALFRRQPCFQVFPLIFPRTGLKTSPDNVNMVSLGLSLQYCFHYTNKVVESQIVFLYRNLYFFLMATAPHQECIIYKSFYMCFFSRFFFFFFHFLELSAFFFNNSLSDDWFQRNQHLNLI